MSLAGLFCAMIHGPCGWVEFIDLLQAVVFSAGSQALLSFRLSSFLELYSPESSCWLRILGVTVQRSNFSSTSNHYVRLHRETIEIHKHQQSFNKKEESLKLNKAWLPALKTTACKRSTNSTQPQGLVITIHKRPANDTKQSQ